MTGLVGKRGEPRALCMIANPAKPIHPADIVAPYEQHGT